VPFQLTGRGSKGEAHQRTLNYALANAARKQAEQNDTGGFGDTGVMTHSTGLPQKPQSPTFSEVGGFGKFGQEAKDPKNRRYFEDVMGGLANFQSFMNPSQPPSA